MGKGTKRGARKARAAKRDITSLRVRLRGKDNAPLTMQELTEGMLEAVRQLKPYESGYRARSVSLYLTMIDDNGEPVRINDANEIVIYPYRSAADDHGV